MVRDLAASDASTRRRAASRPAVEQATCRTGIVLAPANTIGFRHHSVGGFTWFFARRERGGESPTFGARRSEVRKSSGAIHRRDFVTRDPWRANQRCRCMPRRVSFGLGTSRGGSGRVRAEARFPGVRSGRRFSGTLAARWALVRRRFLATVSPGCGRQRAVDGAGLAAGGAACRY